LQLTKRVTIALVCLCASLFSRTDDVFHHPRLITHIDTLFVIFYRSTTGMNEVVEDIDHPNTALVHRTRRAILVLVAECEARGRAG
jgi:hypothetical protein